MNPNIPKEIQEKVQAAAQALAQEDAVGAQAQAVLFPGPLKQVFAPKQDIDVRSWKVRPFYDADWETFAALNHPIDDLRKQAMANVRAGKTQDEVNTERMEVRGPMVWQMAYVLTTPCREVRKLLREKGVAGLNDAAEEKFCETDAFELKDLAEAVMEQMGRYFAPTIGHGPADIGKDGEAPASPPQSSASTLTASAG